MTIRTTLTVVAAGKNALLCYTAGEGWFFMGKDFKRSVSATKAFQWLRRHHGSIL